MRLSAVSPVFEYISEGVWILGYILPIYDAWGQRQSKDDWWCEKMYERRHFKTNKESVRTAKTQISLRCQLEETLGP